MGHAKLAVLISRNWYGGYRCRFGGLLVPLAPLPLTAVRVGVGALVVFGDYQIAPIAARSTAMGRWRLTPPGYGGICLPAGRSVRGSDTPPACHSTPRTPPGGRLEGRGIQRRGPLKGKALEKKEEKGPPERRSFLRYRFTWRPWRLHGRRGRP